ncbi:hypothetical protein OC846_004845 [Tilletia horrida]|uniref:Hypervirulence associated protein TUDOR domain-containing protein n=1 Tax=Tilletia horrida TaxID=155126 RepID=A0AAN6JQG2_9BASI|nr:hypothetical protein OC846_004845 [Tilletia horrida]
MPASQKSTKPSEEAKKEQNPEGLRRSARKRSNPASDKEAEEKAEQPASKKQKTSSTASSTEKKASKTKDDKKPKASGGTHGSKHDSNEAPAKPASKDRLPNKGQKCFWKAMPGWVEGHVEEILTAPKTVNGKKVNASEADPRIVLRSHGPSGKIAVHKVGVCYFDD